MSDDDQSRIARLEERNMNLKERLDKIEARLWWAVAGVMAAVGAQVLRLIEVVQ